MYCDFCGKTLSYNVKYCRYCGRHLKDGFGDTQPLPIIDELILHNAKGEGLLQVPWYKRSVKKAGLLKKNIVWKIIHGLLAILILGGAVYIVVTFKTIKEYQILIGIVGGLFATYLWWRGNDPKIPR